MQCMLCAPGTYSFEREFLTKTNCLICGDNLNFYCNYGGNLLTPKKGFWRTANSTRFYPCLNEDFCELNTYDYSKLF